MTKKQNCTHEIPGNYYNTVFLGETDTEKEICGKCTLLDGKHSHEEREIQEEANKRNITLHGKDCPFYSNGSSQKDCPYFK